MTLELNDHTVQTHDDVIIAGVARRGTEIDRTGTWVGYQDLREELEGTSMTDDRYGVIFDIDEDSGEVTFLTGHPVESTDDLPPEASAVEIPEGDYAVFDLHGADADDIFHQVHEGLLLSTGYRQREGPVLQRYPAGASPYDEDAPFELYVPVDEEV